MKISDVPFEWRFFFQYYTTIILKHHRYEEVPASRQQVADHVGIVCDWTVGQGNIIAMPPFIIRYPVQPLLDQLTDTMIYRRVIQKEVDKVIAVSQMEQAKQSTWKYAEVSQI